MTSSKSYKLYKEFLGLDPAFNYMNGVGTLRRHLYEIQNSWYYKLLPTAVKSYIDTSFELIDNFDSAHRHSLAAVACLVVDIDTYKHNSKAQKEKNKKYSNLRRIQRDNKRSEQLDNMIDEWHKGGYATSLADYLGLTWNEYALWVEKGIIPDKWPRKTHE
jgi:hypothetical protein